MFRGLQRNRTRGFVTRTDKSDKRFRQVAQLYSAVCR